MIFFSDLVIRFSRSWRLFLLAAVVTFGSLYLFIGVIQPRFEALTGGAVPYDLQDELSVEQVYTQLATYSADARQLYYVFSAIDFAFPFFASLFLAAITAFSLRYLWPAAYQWLGTHKLWWLLLIPAVFDWAENIFALTVIINHGQELRGAAAAMIYAKMGKLTLVTLSQILGWGLLLLATVKWIFITIRRKLATN
ncbi:MAG: hypothetical protein ACR2QB_09590 [Gammaproteobacteria bacterium]